MILADTDVLIGYLADVQPLAVWMPWLEQDQLAITVISCFELLSGAREGNRGDRLRCFVAALPLLPLDRDAAGRAANVHQYLEGAGRSIGMGDSLISGIALAQQAPLWTHHFERVKGLKLVEENG